MSESDGVDGALMMGLQISQLDLHRWRQHIVVSGPFNGIQNE
jgi:hypothetical protein